MRTPATLAVAIGTAAALGACGTSATSGRPASPLRVVAAESFWGSLAAQLGGDLVSVTSIITSPDADPHDYEPRAQDGRAVASASLVIVNGAGYDPWATKLLAANKASGRVVLNVGDLIGVKAGGNPHRWYSPPDVAKVIDRVSADYKRLASKDGAVFDQLKAAFTTTGLARYDALIADISAKYRDVPVGASESVFTPMADALGLDLITPQSFLNVVSEGGEPTAADKATIDRQINNRQIRAYVFNSQNATPDVQTQVRRAKSEGIPVVPITETLTPSSATFQGWQATQLQLLQAALSR